VGNHEASDRTDFNPRRLDLARRRRGMTQTELAERVGVDRRALVAYESGEYQPSDETLSRIAAELEFPPAFFFGPELDEPHPDTASFRAMSKLRAPLRESALAQGALALMVGRWIDAKFALPRADLPDLSREPSPEAAAQCLRNLWGLGELPIKNSVHLLESKGVRVFSMDIDAREVDAFSLWQGETPLVILNQYKSAEHARFDACHELGHLVLHRHGSPRDAKRVYEREAHEFASSFLLPRNRMIASAPKFPTLPGLITLKRKWGVSLAALVHRLHKVGALSDWQHRSLYIQISDRGYRTNEPFPMKRETSQVLSKVFAILREDGIGKATVAQELCLSSEELDRMMFGLTLLGLKGGASDDAPRSSGRPKLRIVS
jgi:Zn-dependent peptidase ImmA (M78 family)/DNA-binding XRE family transcriptional regulator